MAKRWIIFTNPVPEMNAQASPGQIEELEIKLSPSGEEYVILISITGDCAKSAYYRNSERWQEWRYLSPLEQLALEAE